MPQRYCIFAGLVLAVFLSLNVSGSAAPKTYRQAGADELQNLGVWLEYDEKAPLIDGGKPVRHISWCDVHNYGRRPADENDRILKLIPLFTETTSLDIYFVPLTDNDLTFMRRLTNLTELELKHTKITGSGLVNIDNLTELRRINLYESPITDVGLEHIAKLWRLWQVDLRLTNVSNSGVDRLAGILKQAWVKSPRCPTFDEPYEARWGDVSQGIQLGVGPGTRYWANRFYVRNATATTLEICTHDLPPQDVKVWITNPATKIREPYDVICLYNLSGIGPLMADMHRLKAGGTIATEFAGCTFAAWYSEFSKLPPELLDQDTLDMEFEISLRQGPLHQKTIVLRSPAVSVDIKRVRAVLAEVEAKERQDANKKP